MTQINRLTLMENALSLYDAAGDGASSAACLLQAAIDTERGLQPLRPGDELDPTLLNHLTDCAGTACVANDQSSSSGRREGE